MRVECALYERCMLPVARCMLHLVEPHDPCRQCSAVQCSAPHCTAPHRNAPQRTTLHSSALQFVRCNMRNAPRRIAMQRSSRGIRYAQLRGSLSTCDACAAASSQRGRRTPSSARDLPARTTRAATCAQWPCCRVKARASGSGRETRVKCSDMRRRCCALHC